MPNGLNMKSVSNSSPDDHTSTVAEAAEVVGGNEGAGAEYLVDGPVEAGWRTLTDTEHATAMADGGHQHRSPRAGQGGGGGRSGRAASDHDGVVTGRCSG